MPTNHQQTSLPYTSRLAHADNDRMTSDRKTRPKRKECPSTSRAHHGASSLDHQASADPPLVPLSKDEHDVAELKSELQKSKQREEKATERAENFKRENKKLQRDNLKLQQHSTQLYGQCLMLLEQNHLLRLSSVPTIAAAQSAPETVYLHLGSPEAPAVAATDGGEINSDIPRKTMSAPTSNRQQAIKDHARKALAAICVFLSVPYGPEADKSKCIQHIDRGRKELDIVKRFITSGGNKEQGEHDGDEPTDIEDAEMDCAVTGEEDA